MIASSPAASLTKRTPDGLVLSLEAPPDFHTLASWWRELELRSQTTLFTSWSWIGSWLKTLPGNCQPQLLVVRAADRIVGLGVVVPSQNRLLKWIPSKCWLLNRSGIRELDTITIEHNGILADRSMAPQVREQAIAFLLADSGRPCIDFGLVDAEHATLAAGDPAWVISSLVAKKSFVVDLEKVRRAPADYLSLLSPNTRSQVRRSLKAYAALGTVSVTEAADLETATQFLDELHVLHTRDWERRASRSNFRLTSLILDFHTHLLASAFDRGEIQLLRFAAGSIVIGYLYNFKFRDRVLYYQAGFRHGLIEKNERPGLVCHALAVEHNARQEFRYYDFLAGDQRYKESLATDCHSQAWCVLRQRHTMSRLDRWLRAQKERRMSARSRALALAAIAPSLAVLSELCFES